MHFSHPVDAAQRHTRGAIAVSLKSRTWTAVLSTCSDSSGVSNKVHVATTSYTPPRYAWRRANLWSFFKWNPSSSSTVARSASSSRSRLCDNNTPAAAVTRLQKGLALFLRIICAVPRVEACDVVFLGVGPLGLFGRLRRLRLGGGVGRGLLAVVSCFVDSINSKVYPKKKPSAFLGVTPQTRH